MENLLVNDIDGILCFFKKIEKDEVLSKIYCVKIRNQDDFIILCENHLIVDFSKCKIQPLCRGRWSFN